MGAELEWRWNVTSQFPCGRRSRRSGMARTVGKAILLHAEQGFGDTIQFIRYAPLTARRGEASFLRANRELLRLMQKKAGVEHVVADAALLPPFDVQCADEPWSSFRHATEFNPRGYSVSQSG